MSQSPARVGMFGGAFDPPHRAHAALAQAAMAQLGLDRLHVVPTGQPWHRSAAPQAPAGHRLAMAQLAFAGMPRVLVDDRELNRSGPTYSVNTLRELQALYPGAQLFLLMGEDQAAGFTGWQAWPEIAQLATLAVAERGDAEGDATVSLLALPGVRAQALQLPWQPVSASAVRARLQAGQDIHQLVDPAVASYIDRHNLYRPA